jgi:hypothetical protein
VDPHQLAGKPFHDDPSAMVNHWKLCESAAVRLGSSSRPRLLQSLRDVAARSKSLVHLSVVVADRDPQSKAPSKIMVSAGRGNVRYGICFGRVFWRRAWNRRQSVVQYCRASAVPVFGVISAADRRLVNQLKSCHPERSEGSAFCGDLQFPRFAREDNPKSD